MGKLILVDDFGNTKEWSLNDVLYQRNSMSSQVHSSIMQILSPYPMGKERSDLSDALNQQGFDQWFLMKLFTCECGKDVLISKVVILNDETMCPACARYELINR